MDLLKKLEECEARYKVVQELVMDPNLVKDQKNFLGRDFLYNRKIPEP